MAYLYLDSTKTKHVLSDQEALIKELNSLLKQVDSVRSGLRHKIACRATIDARLLETKNQIDLEMQHTTNMRDAFTQIIALYQQVERNNLDLLQAKKNCQANSSASEVVSFFERFKQSLDFDYKEALDYLFYIAIQSINPIPALSQAFEMLQKILKNEPQSNIIRTDEVINGELLLKDSDEQKNTFIEEYERDHPETVRDINSFLYGGINNSLSSDDIRDLKYLTYHAREPYKSIFLNSLSEYRIGDLGLDNQAYYSNQSKTVNFDYFDDFSTNPRGSYTTVYHECGHAIDDLGDAVLKKGYDTEGFSAYCSSMRQNVTIRQAIEYDVYYNTENPHSITSIINGIKRQNKPGTGSKGSLDNVIEAYKTGQDPNSLSPDDSILYSEVKRRFQNGLRGLSAGNHAKYESVTDVYGGMTHNELIEGDDDLSTENIGYYAHRKYDDGREYWADQAAPAKELWAEYFSYNMQGNTENLDNLIEYFPTASQLMEQYANVLGRKMS